MTRKHETTSYRKKGLSVFLTVLMILSVVAMSATFVGTVAAANVNDTAEPDDLSVGQVDTTWNLVGQSNLDLADLDDDGTNYINISLAAANDAGVNFTDATIQSVDDTDDELAIGDVEVTEDYVNISMEDSGSLTATNDITDLTLANVHTNETTVAEGITLTFSVDSSADGTFEVEDEEFTSFDIVGGLVEIVEIVDTDRSIQLGQDVATLDFDLNVEFADNPEHTNVTLDFSDIFAQDVNVTDVTNPDTNVDTIHFEPGDESAVLEFGDDDLAAETIQLEFNTSDGSPNANTDLVATDEYGNEDSADFRLYAEGTTTVERTASEEVAFAGEMITFDAEGELDTEVRVINDGTDETQALFTTSPGDKTTRDSTNWNTTDFTVTWDGSDDTDLELRDLDLSVEAADDEIEIGDDLEVEVSTADFSQSDVTGVVLDSDGDEIDDIEPVTVTMDSDGEATLVFDTSDVDEQNVTVEVEHLDTRITEETDEIAIGEPPEVDADVSFGDLTDAAEGDYAKIEFEFEDADDYGDDDIIFWINESDYNLNATLETGDFENDSVTMVWNTERAGQTNVGDEMFSFVEDSENLSVTINDQTDIDADYRLNPGGYDLSVFDDGTGDNVQDTDSLTISERSTGDVSAHIAPADADDYDDNLDWILENSTASDTVANGDLLILEQEVNGIFGDLDEGILHNENISEAFPDPNGNAINGTFTPSEAPAYTDPVTFQHDADNVTVYANSTEGVLYFVYDVEVEDLDEGDTQDWEFDFNITGDEFPYLDDDEEEFTSLTYTVTDRSVSLDKEEAPYQVTPTENGTITGESTLAPGSNITINVAKSGVFSTTDDTTQVDEYGAWEFVHDFSDREVGEEFTITISAVDVDEETYEASFNDTAEADTVSDVDQLEQEISDLEDEISDLEDEISDLEDEIADLEDQVADRDDQISDLEDQLAAAEDDLAEAEADRDGALDELSDAEDEIADLEGQLSDANDEISQLEDDLADAEADDDDDEQPAFGPIAALFALLAGGALIARRRL